MSADHCKHLFMCYSSGQNEDGMESVFPNAGQSSILQKSWRLTQKYKVPVGVNVVVSLVSSQPSLARLYQIEESCPTEEMFKLKAVQKQGLRIDAFFDNLIECLDTSTIKQLEKKCVRIGAIHYRQCVNFSAKNWLQFKSVTVEQVLIGIRCAAQDNQEQAVTKVWTEVLELIQEFMTKGFLQSANEAVHAVQMSFEREDASEKSVISTSSTPHLSMKRRVSKAVMRFRSYSRPRSSNSQTQLTVADSVSNASTSPNVNLETNCMIISEKFCNTWFNMDTESVSHDILLRIIKQNPAYLAYFGLPSTLSVTEASATKEIRRQIQRMNNFLINIFELTESGNWDQIDRQCAKVGAIHYHTGVNFTADNWLLFKRSLSEAFCAIALTIPHLSRIKQKQLERALLLLVQFIVQKMKAGFIEQVLFVHRTTTAVDLTSIEHMV